MTEADIDPAEIAYSTVLDVILEQYEPEDIDGLDIRTSFDDEELTIDVYLHVAGEDTADLVTEAVDRAATAVDQAFDSA